MLHKTSVRSTSLRLHLGSDRALQAVIRTHVIYNACVAHYCREVNRFIRQGKSAGGVVGDAAVRCIENILCAKGDATQLARAIYKPLTDPTSTGNGLKALNEGQAYQDALGRISTNPHSAVSDTEVKRLRMIGNHPAWYKAILAGNAVDERIRKQIDEWVARKRIEYGDGEEGGSGNPILILKRAGWLEQDSPQRIRRFEEALGLHHIAKLAQMDAYAFCTALSKIKAHRTWREKQAERIRDAAKHIEKTYGEAMKQPWWDDLTQIETSRDKLIKKVIDSNTRVFIKEPDKYRIGGNRGALRGWWDIRQLWLSRRWSTHTTEQDLIAIVNAERGKSPERFGDHALFEALAHQSMWHLWDGRDAPADDRTAKKWDRLSLRAQYTSDSRPKRNVKWTLPDPVSHPIAPMYAINSKATPALLIEQFAPHELHFEPRVFDYDSDGDLVITPIPMAFGVNKRIHWNSDGSALLRLGSGNKGAIRVKLGQMGMRIDRFALRHLPEAVKAAARRITSISDVETVTSGIFNGFRHNRHRVFMTTALEFEYTERVTYRATTAKFNDGKPAYILKDAIDQFDGLRVLGANLDQNTSATLSLVCLSTLPGDVSISASEKLYANVEKTWRLDIPEFHTPSGFDSAIQMISLGHRLLRVQNRIGGLHRDKGQDSDMPKLDELMHDVSVLAGLHHEIEQVQDAVGIKAKHAALDALNMQFRRLIHTITRTSGQRGAGGISLNAIDLLERLHRYEQVYATRTRQDGQEHRLGNGFNSGLREKIDNVKRDRAKKIAGTLVNAAVAVNADVVVVEDMSRYKTKWDRPKRENAKLSQWSHREVLAHLVMSTQVHGIVVATVPPHYTTRMAALSGAPGFRVDRFQSAWADLSWWKKGPAKENPKPTDRGLVFLSNGCALLPVGQAHPIPVSKNAAMNIAIRFITNDSRPNRLFITEINGSIVVFSGAASMEGLVLRQDGSSYIETGRRVRIRDDDNRKVAVGSGKFVIRDLSGQVNGGLWTNTKDFWEAVKATMSVPV